MNFTYKNYNRAPMNVRERESKYSDKNYFHVFADSIQKQIVLLYDMARGKHNYLSLGIFRL